MRYDLIIVGGGLVGASLAVALKHSNLKVALVDARLPSSADPRLFALNASSCQFLKNLDVWTSLAPHAAPINQVHVSHQGRFGAVRLNSADIQLPSLGHVIPAHIIEAALNDRLNDVPNLTVYRPATVASLTQDEHGNVVTVNRGGDHITLSSSILVGADGVDSTIRAQLGIDVDVMDYQQAALVTRTHLGRPHHGIAYERFTRQGTVAMLPLVGEECATIWSADSATISQLMALSEKEFMAVLQQAFGYRLGRLQHISQRHQFPLRMVCAKKSIANGVLLLGNSAHTLHPIAAQGFNLALYEVAVLAKGLMSTPIDLQVIHQRMQSQQMTSIGFSHRLTQLLSNQSVLVKGLLQMGMIGLEMIAPLKRQFMLKMLGRSGQVPEWLLDMTE